MQGNNALCTHFFVGVLLALAKGKGVRSLDRFELVPGRKSKILCQPVLDLCTDLQHLEGNFGLFYQTPSPWTVLPTRPGHVRMSFGDDAPTCVSTRLVYKVHLREGVAILHATCDRQGQSLLL